TEPVGAEQAGGAMLLVGADRDDDGPGTFEKGFGLLPGGELQQHGTVSGRAGLGWRRHPSRMSGPTTPSSPAGAALAAECGDPWSLTSVGDHGWPGLSHGCPVHAGQRPSKSWVG